MGTIFGKESVKEPPYEVILERTTNVQTPYELRKYATRYAASVEYSDDENNNNGGRSDGFRTLARYIGVFGTPQNEGNTSIAMTAPVVMEDDNDTHKKNKPTSIAMTAPVVMEDHRGNDGNGGGMKKMMFMLPEEYDDIAKIPKPINPAVHIERIPSETGAVHRYNGNFNSKLNTAMAKKLGEQLLSDGLVDITEKYVVDNFQFWGYNPPFTIPYFRRNEVWLKLNKEQVDFLKETFPPTLSEGGGGGQYAKKMTSKKTMISLGLCGLVLGAYAVGLAYRSRSQYRRL